MSEHLVSPKIYVGVFLALVVFTVTTYSVAMVDLGPFNALVAIVIAMIKSMLVILFFMHVKYSPKMTKVTIFAGFCFLLILLSLSMTDYISRPWTGPESGARGVQPAQQP
ncbi:MAG TPA: cytochrome C oxidase subunit IV family protein [Terriglobales bacterium]|nr:cytochrome C oxidase subunit IV family protein [Terriglobales bacterium]